MPGNGAGMNPAGGHDKLVVLSQVEREKAVAAAKKSGHDKAMAA